MKTIDVKNWIGVPVRGLTNLLTLCNSQPYESVEVKNINKAYDLLGVPMDSVYSSGVNYIDEAIQFEDGSILILCSTSVFVDTNSESNNNSIAYFHLTQTARNHAK